MMKMLIEQRRRGFGSDSVEEWFIYWNFVASSKDRLAQAASDWKAGKMKLPDADDKEFIPLPDQRVPFK